MPRFWLTLTYTVARNEAQPSRQPGLPPDAPIDGSIVETDADPQDVAVDALSRFISWEFGDEPIDLDTLPYQSWEVGVWENLSDFEFKEPLAAADFTIENEDW